MSHDSLKFLCIADYKSDVYIYLPNTYYDVYPRGSQNTIKDTSRVIEIDDSMIMRQFTYIVDKCLD